VLLNIPGLEPHYMLIADREGTLDTAGGQVEVGEKLFAETGE